MSLIKRALVITIALLVLVPLLIALEAHIEMRSLADPLPTDEALVAFGTNIGPAGPTRMFWVESGRQPRSSGGTSITGSFVLEWPDGRLFAIDTGMTDAGMTEFNVTMETVMGGGKGESFGSLGQQIGARAKDVAGVGFTHLHIDHTEGSGELCDARGEESLPVFQTPAQYSRVNYMTTDGRDAIDGAGCLTFESLEAEGGLLPVPGFPGLAAFSANGHTPGSTVWVARVAGRLLLLAGDITNVHEHLMNDIPKGAVYSYLIVPESTARLGILRRRLARLHGRDGVDVLVSHDPVGAVEAGVRVWPNGDR